MWGEISRWAPPLRASRRCCSDGYASAEYLRDTLSEEDTRSLEDYAGSLVVVADAQVETDAREGGDALFTAPPEAPMLNENINIYL